MNASNFEADFKGVSNKQDIIKRMVSIFRLPDSSESSWNWDSFEGYFTNLDPDSEVVRNSDPKPDKIHLVVKNVKDVKNVSEKDYETLLSVLDHATKKENRGDRIQFTYDLGNGEGETAS